MSCGRGSVLIWILYIEFGPAMSKHNKSEWLALPICFVLFNMRKLKHHMHSPLQTEAGYPMPEPCQKPPLGASDDSTFVSNKAICLFFTLLLHISQNDHLSSKLLFLKLLAFTLLASKVRPLTVCPFIKLGHHNKSSSDITKHINLLKQHHNSEFFA